MPITCDSGAQISVVPEECVTPDEFTGEVQEIEDFHTGRVTGRVCQIAFTIAGKEFRKKAVTQPGELLRWTPCMAVLLSPRGEMEFILGLIEEKEAVSREDICYLPPSLRDGMVVSGVMAYDGKVVPGCKAAKEVKGKSEAEQIVEKEESFEEAINDLARIEIEGEGDKRSSSNVDEAYGDHGPMVEAERYDEASVVDEEVGESSGGCAEKMELALEGIKGSRSVLVEESKKDTSLSVARGLAERGQERYSYKDGVILRARLDRTGNVKNQICLPSVLRGECMRLAHTKFGHMGRNKMCQLITP